MRPWLKDETAACAVWRILADAGIPVTSLQITRAMKGQGWTDSCVWYALRALEATRLVSSTPHGRGWLFRVKAIGEVVPPYVRWHRYAGRDRRERTATIESTQP